MRFVPHRNEVFQLTLDNIPSDYDSLSEGEYASSCDDSDIDSPHEFSPNSENLYNDKNNISTIMILDDGTSMDENLTSDLATRRGADSIVEITSLLENCALGDKYKMLTEHNNATDWDGIIQRSIRKKSPTPPRPEVVQDTTKSLKSITDQILNRNGSRGEGVEDPYAGYLAKRFDDHQRKNEERFQQVIAQEEERLRLEEEKRKQEEERKRIAEEERKQREEAERKRLEEEAKKRQEEEERLRKEEEERKKLEEEKKIKEAAALKAAEEEATKKRAELAKRMAEEKQKLAESKAKQKSMTSNDEITKLFLKYKNDIADIKLNIVDDLQKPENADLKKIVNAHKRKINPKFGQLTDSNSQLVTITDQLKQLIDATLANEKAKHWILNFVAKAIVSQAESEVAVKASSSVALAQLAVNLLVLYPDLKYYLMARFVKKCPLVIGYSCSVDTVEGRLRMGYKRKQDDKWEDELQYDERLGGIATVYCVMCRTQLNTNQYAGKSHPLPISNGWIMASRILNLPQESLRNVHFTIIAAWWDSCSSEMLIAYGKQTRKLLTLIYTQWSMCVPDKKFSAAARLWLLGEEYEKTGKLVSFPKLSV